MRASMRLFILTILLLAGLSAHVAGAQEVSLSQKDLHLLNDLNQAIVKVAKKHKLKPEDAYAVLKRANGEGPSWPLYGKGGVSIIRDEVYIINSAPNELVVDGRHWISEKGNARELVVVSGKRLVTSVPIPPDKLSDDLIFILFDGPRIRFYDWKDFSGATTYREPGSVPPSNLSK